MKILYLASAGSLDPTRASIPLHIAANGSVATELASREKAERVEGVGIPPAKELFQKLIDNQVPVYV